MLVSVTVDDGSETLITVDTFANITDSNGFSWNPKYPISISVARNEPIVTFEHKAIGTAQGAYEEMKSVNGEKCNTNEFCCETNTKRWLSHNSTVYNIFEITSMSIEYYIKINVFQHDLSFSLGISPQYKTDSSKGVKATLDYDMIQLNNFDYRDYVYVVEAERFGKIEGFIMPKKYFGSDINQVGITEEMYKRKLDCFQPRGYSTKIGANIFDQFHDFREKFISLDMKCMFQRQVLQSFSVRCPKTSSTTLQLELPIGGDNGFKIQKLYGNPYVVSKGSLSVRSSSLSLYLDVFNNLETTGRFEFTLDSCCYSSGGKQSCNPSVVSKYVKTVEGFDTKRVYFSVVPIVTYFENGYCTVLIGQYGKVEKQEEISFYVASKVVEPDSYGCFPPKLKTIVGGKIVCITNCPSKDTAYNETIYQCVPVDCNIKYSGKKQYFNPAALVCEEKKTCIDWKENYDAHNNVCVTKKEFESKSLMDEYGFNSENDFIKVYSLNCEPGFPDRMDTVCKCPNDIISLAESTAFCDINLNSLTKVPDTFELPPPTFFESLCDLPNWAQITLIALLVLALLLLIPLAIVIVFCCIKRVDPKKEATKVKYGEKRKKSFVRRLKTAVVKGDFSSHEYVITDERKALIQASKLERKKLEKKKKKVKII